jgi:hypothetical protein
VRVAVAVGCCKRNDTDSDGVSATG